MIGSSSIMTPFCKFIITWTNSPAKWQALYSNKCIIIKNVRSCLAYLPNGVFKPIMRGSREYSICTPYNVVYSVYITLWCVYIDSIAIYRLRITLPNCFMSLSLWNCGVSMIFIKMLSNWMWPWMGSLIILEWDTIRSKYSHNTEIILPYNAVEIRHR